MSLGQDRTSLPRHGATRAHMAHYRVGSREHLQVNYTTCPRNKNIKIQPTAANFSALALKVLTPAFID